MEHLKLSGKKTLEDYLKIFEYAKNYDHSKFLEGLKNYFGF